MENIGPKILESNEQTTTDGFHFGAYLKKHQVDIHPLCIETLQINITKLCNLL